jgi:hypothetical protein
VLSGNVANAQYIIHIAGAITPGHEGDSAEALHASLRCPTSVCFDTAGNLYIADGGPLGYLNDGCIRKVEATTGYISTYAGVRYAEDSASNTADSMPAVNAKLQGCASIFTDKKGNMLIADGYSCIMKVNIATGYITRVAGIRGSVGYSGDGGPATAALFNGPCDVTVDGANNIYVADLNNHVIRRINSVTGIVSTVAGKNAVGYSGDGGPAIMARLNQPRGIYVDNSGNLYIADYNNNRVRMVSATSGIITTIAGDGGPGFEGDGGLATAARLSQPIRLTMDSHGDLFISDAANQRVRKYRMETKVISTYAGNGEYFSGPDIIGDDGPATAAKIDPYGLTFDDCDNLFLGSALYSIRVVTPSTIPFGGFLCGLKTNGVTPLSNSVTKDLKVYPNPNSGSFTVLCSSTVIEPLSVTVTDVTGRLVLTAQTATNKAIDLKVNVPGMYFVNVAGKSGSAVTKLAVQ